MIPVNLLRVCRFEPRAPGEKILAWVLSLSATLLTLTAIFTLAQAVDLFGGPRHPAEGTAPSLFHQLLRSARWFPRVTEPQVRLFCLVLTETALAVAAIVARLIVERIARWRAEGVAASLRAALRLQVRRLEGAEMICGRSLAAVDLLTRGVEVLRQALVAWWCAWPFDLLLLLGLSVATLVVQPWIGLSIGLLAALAMLTLASQETRSSEKQSAAAEQAGTLLQQLVDHVRQPRLVNGRLLDDVPGLPFEKLGEQYRQAALSEQAAATEGRLLLAVITAVSATLLFWLIGSNVLRAELDLAGAVAILAAVGCAYRPLRRLRGALVVAASARPTAEGLLAYLDRAPRIGELPGAAGATEFYESIDFDHVSLPDAAGRMLLDDATFRVPAGSRLAIVSSDNDTPLAVACLLSRHCDPSRGAVRFDGQDIRQGTLDAHRDRMALVLRHGLLFAGSVRDNIACGDDSFTAAQITDALKSVLADDLLRSLPSGLETMIGDHAAQLSPAEIFRIGAARAWLRRPLLVVVDEPPATEDAAVDETVNQTERALAQGRTAIIFAQRLSTLRQIERILVFHEGRLVGDGKHADLIHGNELYRHLVYVRFTDTGGA